jgi:hypothetical protein
MRCNVVVGVFGDGRSRDSDVAQTLRLATPTPPWLPPNEQGGDGDDWHAVLAKGDEKAWTIIEPIGTGIYDDAYWYCVNHWHWPSHDVQRTGHQLPGGISGQAARHA